MNSIENSKTPQFPTAQFVSDIFGLVSSLFQTNKGSERNEESWCFSGHSVGYYGYGVTCGECGGGGKREGGYGIDILGTGIIVVYL